MKVVHGDGAFGVPEGAPYDRIVGTVGAWDIPPAWLEQLAPAGKLVLPLHVGGDPHDHLLVSLGREGDHLAGRSLLALKMVVMRGEHAAPEAEPPTRAGEAWEGASSDRLLVKVYPRGVAFEMASNQKVIEKHSCLVVLERDEAAPRPEEAGDGAVRISKPPGGSSGGNA